MKKLSFICIVCKEKLEIDSNVSSFNCSSCKTPLSVQKTNGIAYLKPMTKDDHETKVVSKLSKAILVEKEIERLDREWLLKRKAFPNKIDYLDTDRSPEETAVNGVIQGVVVIGAIGFVLFWISSAKSMGAPPFFVGFGCLFLFILVGKYLTILMGNNTYQNSKNDYLKERENLKRKLEKNK